LSIIFPHFNSFVSYRIKNKLVIRRRCTAWNDLLDTIGVET